MLYRSIYILSGEMKSNSLCIKNHLLNIPADLLSSSWRESKLTVNTGVYFLLFHQNENLIHWNENWHAPTKNSEKSQVAFEDRSTMLVMKRRPELR